MKMKETESPTKMSLALKFGEYLIQSFCIANLTRFFLLDINLKLVSEFSEFNHKQQI